MEKSVATESGWSMVFLSTCWACSANGPVTSTCSASGLDGKFHLWPHLFCLKFINFTHNLSKFSSKLLFWVNFGQFYQRWPEFYQKWPEFCQSGPIFVKMAWCALKNKWPVQFSTCQKWPQASQEKKTILVPSEEFLVDQLQIYFGQLHINTFHMIQTMNNDVMSTIHHIPWVLRTCFKDVITYIDICLIDQSKNRYFSSPSQIPASIWDLLA